MAKNTGNTKFRKIDVDQYSEDRYVDEMNQDEGPQGPNEGEVQSMLNQNNNSDALVYVLKNAPIASKNSAVKEKAQQVVLKVLLSFKSSEIDQIVKSLDQTQLDTLMKYIYRGFEIPSERSSAQLLTWHDKVFAKGGVGCIVRVLTDRKKV